VTNERQSEKTSEKEMFLCSGFNEVAFTVPLHEQTVVERVLEPNMRLVILCALSKMNRSVSKVLHKGF
jgi:hypothetical protein